MNIRAYLLFYCLLQIFVCCVDGENAISRRWEVSCTSLRDAVNILSKHLAQQAWTSNVHSISQQIIRRETSIDSSKLTTNYLNLRQQEQLNMNHFQTLNSNSTSTHEKESSHITLIMIAITAGAVIGVVVSALCCCFFGYKCIHSRKGRGKVYEEEEGKDIITDSKNKTPHSSAENLISPRDKSISVKVAQKGSVTSTTSAGGETKTTSKETKKVAFVAVTADDVDKEVYRNHRQTHRESIHHISTGNGEETSDDVHSQHSMV